MNARSYFLFTAFIFAAIALIHLVRFVSGWAFTIGSFTVPMAGSVVGFLIAAAISYWGIRLSRGQS